MGSSHTETINSSFPNGFRFRFQFHNLILHWLYPLRFHDSIFGFAMRKKLNARYSIDSRRICFQKLKKLIFSSACFVVFVVVQIISYLNCTESAQQVLNACINWQLSEMRFNSTTLNGVCYQIHGKRIILYHIIANRVITCSIALQPWIE